MAKFHARTNYCMCSNYAGLPFLISDLPVNLFPIRMGEYAELRPNKEPPSQPEGFFKKMAKKGASTVGLGSSSAVSMVSPLPCLTYDIVPMSFAAGESTEPSFWTERDNLRVWMAAVFQSYYVSIILVHVYVCSTYVVFLVRCLILEPLLFPWLLAIRLVSFLIF